MSIQLFSGLPGAGKTLSLLDRLLQIRAKEPHRPVYAYGIAGLRDGLALPVDPKKPPIPNPKFGEVDEPEFLPWWAQLPHGSVICIDEAQKIWPPSRLSGKELARESLDISMLNEHRHWGYDFLLTTQNPSYLHKHVVGLIGGDGGQHVHVVRRWGGKTVDRYVWEEGQKDVGSRSVRALGRRQRWKYPKQLYSLYQSSTVHTGKRRLPWQYFLMIGAAVLAVPMIWFAVHRIVGLRHLAKDSGVSAAPVSSSERSGFSIGGERKKWATVADYVTDHLPRVANQPWSAPVFDQEAVAAKPDLLCIEHEDKRGTPDESGVRMMCSCYTEQVTPYELHSLEECRRYARHGVYNPRRSPIGGDRYVEREQYSRERPQGAVAGSAADADRDAGAWQPAWRTRAYVQPERTAVTATVPQARGG